MNKSLIAPCGINCGICKAHLRENNPCHGCRDTKHNKPKTRSQCQIRICKKRKGGFCYDCKELPCSSLKHLDNRYRNRYGVSQINNLKYIKDKGVVNFLEKEKKKWISKKGILCMHDKKRYKDIFLKINP